MALAVPESRRLAWFRHRHWATLVFEVRLALRRTLLAPPAHPRRAP